MKKLFACLTIAVIVASCGDRGGGGGTTPATDTACAESANTPDSLFFPVPDKEKALYPAAATDVYDSRDYPFYIAYVGRYASFGELKSSLFYGLLCQRVPPLRKVNGFSVSTSKGIDDVWMLVPAAKGVWCKIKEATPALLDRKEDLDKAKVLYASESLEPILIHASMEGRGSLFIDISTASADKEFAWTGTVVIPRYDEYGNLMCVPEEYELDEDTLQIPLPDPEEFWTVPVGRRIKPRGGDYSLKLNARGRLSVRYADGSLASCRFVPYRHKGNNIIAVKSDDGSRRAVLVYEKAWSEKASDYVFMLQQSKGNLLPDNDKHEYSDNENE